MKQIKEALATILTKNNYMFWKLVNSFKMMKLFLLNNWVHTNTLLTI